MAQKKTDNREYDAFKAALAEGSPEKLYVFYGEERYLLEHYLSALRKLFTGDGFAEFNCKRLDTRSFSLSELSAAVDALPVFAQRTFLEIHDVDIFKLPEQTRDSAISILTQLPEYICVVLVYDTAEYKPDGRLKCTAAFKKAAHAVEFALQPQSQLVRWIQKHFANCGKDIAQKDAEYLAFITGGLMNTLSSEIEKVSSYCTADSVTRRDIDDVVTPVPDAVSYKLSDAIIQKHSDEAMALLNDLINMKEPAQKLIFGVSLRLRQMLAAKICLENGLGAAELMEMCGIRFDFQAKALLSGARRSTKEACRRAVLMCCETAFKLNSGSEPQAAMCDLVLCLTAADILPC